MKNKFLIFLTLFILSVLLLNFAVSYIQKSKEVTVSAVIDGDTIKMGNGEFVRLLGIDTPEKGQPFYEEAKTALAELVGGKEAILEKDHVNRDVYGRLLRYVRVGKVLANSEMVRMGYSKSLASSSSKYFLEFKNAERIARQEKLGIWE